VTEAFEQLAESVNRGRGPSQTAATRLLAKAQMPPGVDLRVGAAIFLAVLGRVTELDLSGKSRENDYDSAGLMLLVLQRALQVTDPPARVKSHSNRNELKCQQSKEDSLIAHLDRGSRPPDHR